MFIKDIVKHYSFNLLASASLFVVILALRLESNPVSIFYLFLGCFFGTFLLDMDYFVFSFFAEPNHHFSRRIREFAAQKNLPGMFSYIFSHKEEIPRLTLHSALFQIILATALVYVLTSSDNIFGQSFVLSAFLQSVLVLTDEFVKTQNISNWFWILKDPPSARFIKGYIFFSFLVFLYGLFLIG
jgi:hypothetical protein